MKLHNFSAVTVTKSENRCFLSEVENRN